MSRQSKKIPDRGKIFKRLRGLPNGGLEFITLSNGSEIAVNPMKHFLLKKEYVNVELQNHLFRKIGKMAIGEEKYAELEKQALEAQTKKTS